jgi:hypothetical protein
LAGGGGRNLSITQTHAQPAAAAFFVVLSRASQKALFMGAKQFFSDGSNAANEWSSPFG